MHIITVGYYEILANMCKIDNPIWEEEDEKVKENYFVSIVDFDDSNKPTAYGGKLIC